MINIEEIIIRDLIFHRITSNEDNSMISKETINYSNDNEEEFLKRILLKPFISCYQTFEFNHDVNLEYNVLFNLCKSIYENDDFVLKSGNIAQHLISSSKHPNIKDGDLFLAKLEDINFNGKYYEGLGIYKFEDKENYIETSITDERSYFSFHQGIGNKKPEKACLIIFTEKPYTLLVIDNGVNETEYWQKEFINHKLKNDKINSTNNFLNITKNFITKHINNEFEVTKTDQIDLLNRSVDYFKTHDLFDKQEFEATVFNDNNVIELFQKFNHIYKQENEIEFPDNFEISTQVVKKLSRAFKSVLKLDKNFHIYIHGNRNLIQQGIDEKGRKYYKIYYEEES